MDNAQENGADVAAYFRARQLAGVRRLDRYTLSSNFLCAILLGVFSWNLAPHIPLVVWALAICGLDIFRIHRSRRSSAGGATDSGTRADLTWATLQTGLTAALYGLLFVYLYSRVDAFGLVILACVSAGMIASGAIANAMIPQSAIAWVGVLTLFSLYALFTAPNGESWLLASLLALYAVFITIAATFMARLYLGSEINEARARTRLVDAIESLSVGFLLWDRERKLMLTNRPARDIVDDLKELGIPGSTMTAHQSPRNDGLEGPIEMKASNGRWFGVRERITREGGVVAICSDITERKLAQEMVAREAHRYQTILKTASDGIHVVDEQGRLVEASASFLRELRYPEDPMPALTVADWDVNIKREDVPGVMQRRMAMPPGVFETQHFRSDGTIYDAEVSSQLVVFEGRKHLYCSSRNITERKRAAEERTVLERQLRHSLKLEAVGQLTGGVAHDFNNLLAVLLGRLQMIQEELRDNPKVSDWTRICIDVVERGASLTKSLLAFSRQQSLVPIEVNLNVIVNDLVEIMRRTLGATIDIKVVPGDQLWPCEVDPGQLQNALLNLALNARDAMAGGGRLIVETGNIQGYVDGSDFRADAKPGDFVMLAVSDNGAGMPPDVIERAFEPFFTTKDTGKGSGLGLSMVYGFVNQSGGHIKIDSEVGRGTTIRIYLPRKVGTSRPTGTRRVQRQSIAGQETVLLVEDNDDLRDLTKMQLDRLGYTVFAAGDAEAGLSLLRDHPEIALLLTDIVLPHGVNGIELGERAVALRPRLKVLSMTGYTDQAALDALHASQPGRVLHKPFHREELASAVRAALDQT